VNDVAQFTRRLRLSEGVFPTPLLVLRLRDLERIAWREGRATARAVERRSLRRFVETAARTLRNSDLLGHDNDSEDFLVGLISPTRSSGSVAAPTDCRATLARLASAMQFFGELHVETGWTILTGVEGDPRLQNAVEQALERGGRERERYAFFSTIGHELRTPLTSIRGYIETLLEDDLDPQTSRRFLEIARDEAMRVGRLVESMFDVSMLDLRAGYVRGESSDLGPVSARAIDAVVPLAAARSSTIAPMPSEQRRVAIAADRLTQALVNVLENAIKHGREGGHVVVSSELLDGKYIEIRIDDDGPGVPAEEREAIFTLTRRGRLARAHGSGIGLAVVRLMIERIGGEVDVIDSPLGGARFRIRLPLIDEAEANPEGQPVSLGA
jgi:signal transduction histidine kinase